MWWHPAKCFGNNWIHKKDTESNSRQAFTNLNHLSVYCFVFVINVVAELELLFLNGEHSLTQQDKCISPKDFQ